MTKLRLRIVPVAVAELAAGREARGCAAVFAACFVGRFTRCAVAPNSTLADAPARDIDARLADNAGFCRAVEAAASDLLQSLSPS